MAVKSTNPDILFYERAAREYCESLGNRIAEAWIMSRSSRSWTDRDSVSAATVIATSTADWSSVVRDLPSRGACHSYLWERQVRRRAAGELYAVCGGY